jgi:hypothetical protein
MDKEKSIVVLTLLLINKGESFNNSYRLMRMLEWEFLIVDSKKVLDIIKERKYAEYEIIKAVHYYKITSLGMELIKQGYNDALELLLHEYPQESEIVLSLFQSFSPS